MLLDFMGRPVGNWRDNFPGVGEERPIGSHIKEFRDWRKAAEESTTHRAISRQMWARVPWANGKRVMLKVQIVMPVRGEPYMVYASASGIQIKGKITARHVDSIHWWRAY